VQCCVETVEKEFFARLPLLTASCCDVGPQFASLGGALPIPPSSKVCLYPSLVLTSVQPLSSSTPFLRSHPIMNYLFDILHHAVEHPLHVDFDLAPQRKTI
jgi:hypothetical protein